MGKQQLRRTLSVPHGVALAVSMVVGSGLLGLPGLALDAGGVAGATLGWVLTTLMSIPLIYIFARLGLQFRSSAGLVKYAEAAGGPAAASGATAVLVGTFVICIPVGTMIGAAYIRHFFQLPTQMDPWVAVAILVLMTAVNLAGIRTASIMNSAAVIALITLVVLLVCTNLPFAWVGLATGGNVIAGQLPLDLSGVWAVCAVLFWAFLGWENLGFGLEEFKDPQRSIPRVFWISFLVVVVLYLALAVVSIGAHASGTPICGAAGLVELLTGTATAPAIELVMVLVILANVNAWLFGASRFVYAAGRDRVLPRAMAQLSRNATPMTSLLALLAGYLFVIFVMRVFRVSLSTMVALVSQNFLVLYAFSITAIAKTQGSWQKWPAAVAAFGSCVFLLGGFGIWLLYPGFLIATGVLAFRYQMRAKADAARQDAVPFKVLRSPRPKWRVGD